jgi:hypothetical protein
MCTNEPKKMLKLAKKIYFLGVNDPPEAFLTRFLKKKKLVHSLAKVAGWRAGVRRPHFTIT